MNEVIPVVELDGGLRAAFISMPHFRTSSARLTIHAGSLHETGDTAGAAHFLEHITFQGTKEFPTEEAGHQFSQDHGIKRNAFTGQTRTSYVADGYELEPVMKSVVQTALFPLLTEISLAHERMPIIDEARSRMSSPFFEAQIKHATAIRGEAYGKPGIGSIKDIHSLTHEHLTDFYAQNYKLGNAVLVLCSSEPPSKQRAVAERLLSGYVESTVPSDPKLPLGIEVFNPSGVTHTGCLLDQPTSAQSHTSITYELPSTLDQRERIQQSVLKEVLSQLAHRRLRSELAISYGASATLGVVNNLQHGLNQSWAHLTVGASMNGSEVLDGLIALNNDVLFKDLPEKVVARALLNIKRELSRVLESNPAGIANMVNDGLSAAPLAGVDLEQASKLADTISVESINDLRKDVVSTQPVVGVSSPSQDILDDVAGWAITHQ